MKALSLIGIGELRLEDRRIPQPKDKEVLVEIKACGICSSDEDRIFKNGTYHFPTVPGHEFAGRIIKIGKNADKSLLGRKASVFPLLPCFECDSCQRGEYATCKNYMYFGSRNDGGFSEYLVVPEWNINLLDESVTFEVGALSEPASVACHAMKKGGVKADDTVLVIGTGAIGILIAGMCKRIKALPIVAGRRAESVSMVKGYDLKSIETKDVASFFKDTSIDVVFDAVGSNESMELAIESVKPNGTIVAVGNPKEDFFQKKEIYWKILRKQITLCGTWNSSFKIYDDDWETVAEMMKEKSFPFEKLVSATYTLDQYEAALNHLRDKSVPKTRIMFVMNPEDK